MRRSRSRLPPGGASTVTRIASKPDATASSISARVTPVVLEAVELEPVPALRRGGGDLAGPGRGEGREAHRRARPPPRPAPSRLALGVRPAAGRRPARPGSASRPARPSSSAVGRDLARRRPAPAAAAASAPRRRRCRAASPRRRRRRRSSRARPARASRGRTRSESATLIQSEVTAGSYSAPVQHADRIEPKEPPNGTWPHHPPPSRWVVMWPGLSCRRVNRNRPRPKPRSGVAERRRLSSSP